jgi:hypothetical protein
MTWQLKIGRGKLYFFWWQENKPLHSFVLVPFGLKSVIAPICLKIDHVVAKEDKFSVDMTHLIK